MHLAESEPVKVEALLTDLFGEYADQCRGKIRASSLALFQPPRSTTLRINTLLTESISAKACIDNLMCTMGGFTSVLLPDLDTVEIPAQGPNQITSCGKRIIVDLGCAAAVLRGSEVFAVGVLAMDPLIGRGDRVSIWADLGRKCLKGYKKDYSGALSFVANGVSIMV